MKKILLFLALGCVGANVNAEIKAPKIYDSVSFQKISNDGNLIASEVYGAVQIFDVKGNTQYDYIDETGGLEPYGLGIGNAFSKDNVLVGYAGGEANAAYWQNGKWTLLPLSDETSRSNIANGITPDGSRICGSVGVLEITLDDATMVLPAVWERGADGTYGKYTILPHPTQDFLGRAPQYITANTISDDGKTIAGTMTDCVGRLVTPVLYTQNEAGEWSYSLPMEKYFNPDKIEVPEYPGEYPQMPDATDYMSDEEIAAFNEAYQKWVDSFYEGEMPEYADYMTADEKAKYEEAYNKWLAEATEFEAKQDVYLDALEEIYNSSTGIVYNNILVSHDGKKIAVTAIRVEPDPNGWWPGATKDINNVWIIDLEGGETVKYEDALANVHAWNSDGSISAWGSIWDNNPAAYILANGKATSFYDYLTALSPELKEWVDENMSHVVETYDWETEEVIQSEECYVGLPLLSGDLKTLACWTPTPWDYDILYQGYVFDLAQFGGVDSAVVAGDDLKLYVDKAGEITVAGEAASLEVYNLQGVKVESAGHVSGPVDLKLDKGAYIVKAVSPAGKVAVAKVVK